MRILTANDVIIPIIGFEDLFEDNGLTMSQGFPTARFVVKAAPIAFAHIGLVTDHFKSGLFSSLTAQLNPAVYETRPFQFDFQPQIEVLELRRRAEEVIVRHRFGQSAAHQRAFFDAPGAVRVAFPTTKTLAIE